MNGLLGPGDIIALKGTQVPGEDVVKGFFSFYVGILSVNDLAFAEANQSLLRPAPHMHATAVPTYAEQLNHVIKTRICDCAAETLTFPLFFAFHHGRMSPGPEILLPICPTHLMADLRPALGLLVMAEK